MTRIKAKLRNIGHSRGVIIPKEVITNYILGEEIELEVITKQADTTPEVITEPLFKKEWFNTEMCEKHEGSRKGTCGCV